MTNSVTAQKLAEAFRSAASRQGDEAMNMDEERLTGVFQELLDQGLIMTRWGERTQQGQ